MNNPLRRGVFARDIQVSGLKNFGSDWQSGLKYYLEGVGGNEDRVMYRPKINFGSNASPFPDVSLRLSPGEGVYYAHGTSSTFYPKGLKGDEIIRVDGAATETHWGMMRFVHDDAIKLLVVHLPHDPYLNFWEDAMVTLWKNPSGVLEVSAIGIPTLEEYIERVRLVTAETA